MAQRVYELYNKTVRIGNEQEDGLTIVLPQKKQVLLNV